MELILRCSAVAVTMALVCLLIKKTNPEIAMLLSICSVCVMLIAIFGMSKTVVSLVDTIKQLYGTGSSYISPIIKCLAISIITKVSCDFCKEAGQAAASSTLELAGTVCALTVALPMLTNVLKLIGGMI